MFYKATSIPLENVLVRLEYKEEPSTNYYNATNCRGVVTLFPNLGIKHILFDGEKISTTLSYDVYSKELKDSLAVVKPGDLFRVDGKISRNYGFSSSHTRFEGETEKEIRIETISPINSKDTRFESIGNCAVLIEINL